MARDLSLEVSPREALRGAEGLETLAPGTRVFITRLPKGSFEETLAASTRLRELGLRPVPHITARTTSDAATFAKQLGRYVGEAGVREILLVAGSNEKAEGAFSNTLQILESGVIESSGLTALNVAGHPEGHPQADERELHRALEVKNAFSTRTGIPLTIVTQFFFDPAPIIAWEARIREKGNRLPIDIGLHGVTGVASLAKHAVACGVGASIKVLGSHSGSVLQFAQIRTPDRLLSGLAAAKARDPANLFRNIHVFPLGGFKRTVEWANAVRNGRYSFASDGQLEVATSD
ncbi:methylenetetrahydrofolate reductase [Methylorubrum extorquens]|uniref:methylenetetrahydrofolate reductase n=1 Tax=Methylorubrum extorquens TaxID=408 RepID=UPI0006769D0D|nr:methylenetetrahydrofolate reductase [Methylorubrum extorquens]